MTLLVRRSIALLVLVMLTSAPALAATCAAACLSGSHASHTSGDHGQARGHDAAAHAEDALPGRDVDASHTADAHRAHQPPAGLRQDRAATHHAGCDGRFVATASIPHHGATPTAPACGPGVHLCGSVQAAHLGPALSSRGHVPATLHGVPAVAAGPDLWHARRLASVPRLRRTPQVDPPAPPAAPLALRI